MFDQGAIRHAQWLGQRRFLQADIFGNFVQNAARHPDILRECAVNLEAVTLALPANVIIVGPAQDALATIIGVGFGSDSVADLPASHVGADFGDDAGEFMAQNQRHIDLVGHLVVVHMGIAAADADIRGFYQHIIRADRRDRHFANFGRPRHIVILYDCLHRFHVLIPFNFLSIAAGRESSGNLMDTSSIVVRMCSCIQCRARSGSRSRIASKIRR